RGGEPAPMHDLGRTDGDERLEDRGRCGNRGGGGGTLDEAPAADWGTHNHRHPPLFPLVLLTSAQPARRRPDASSNRCTVFGSTRSVRVSPGDGRTRWLKTAISSRPPTSATICTWAPVGSTRITVPSSPTPSPDGAIAS